MPNPVQPIGDPEGRLRTDRPYGQHIPLTCKHHPTLRWSTKNIAPIGCRSIFFMGEVGKSKLEQSEECACSVADLIVLEEPLEQS